MQTQLALTAVLFAACADRQPDLVDEIVQDVGPTPPAYASADPAGEPSFDELMATYCPGIVTRGAPTYRGLSGTYQYIGVPAAGEPWRLTLLAQHDDPDAAGTFLGTRVTEDGWLAGYAGRFAALPDNPAIGAVFAFDTDGDERWDEVHFVLGITRTFGLVRGLCLAGAEHPFLLARVL